MVFIWFNPDDLYEKIEEVNLNFGHEKEFLQKIIDFIGPLNLNNFAMDHSMGMQIPTDRLIENFVKKDLEEIDHREVLERLDDRYDLHYMSEKYREDPVLEIGNELTTTYMRFDYHSAAKEALTIYYNEIVGVLDMKIRPDIYYADMKVNGY